LSSESTLYIANYAQAEASSTIPLPSGEKLEKAMLSTSTNWLLALSNHGTKPYAEEVLSEQSMTRRKGLDDNFGPAFTSATATPIPQT